MYENDWIKVREDQVVHDGGEGGVFGVIEKPDSATVVPFQDDGFYMVRQYRYPIGAWRWEFPQGSWPDKDKAVDDPASLARSELKEESGIEAEHLEEIGYLHMSYGMCTEGAHVFVATGLTRGEQELESTEAGTEVAWHSLEEVWRLVDSGQVSDSSTLAAMALFHRWRSGRAAQGQDRDL